MEIRVLKYFLAIAREQNITNAAASLYISQPTLSRQIHELEDELGKPLFIRGSRKITLTKDGMLLRKRAEEIIALCEETENEIMSRSDDITGEIRIGAAETSQFNIIAKAAKKMKAQYPFVNFRIISADGADVSDRIEKGLVDFGLIYDAYGTKHFDYISFPKKDIHGIYMKADSPLAKKEYITPKDLEDKPILISKQTGMLSTYEKWAHKSANELNIASYYNLNYNALLMVREGMGYSFSIDKLDSFIDNEKSGVVFRKLNPPIEEPLNFVWKKYQVMTPACEKFLEFIQKEVEEE